MLDKYFKRLKFYCVKFLGNLTWNAFYLFLKFKMRCRNCFTLNFSKTLFVNAKLSQKTNDALASIIFQDEMLNKNTDDYPKGYLYDPGVLEKLDQVNRPEIEKYRKIDDAGKKILATVSNQIEDYLYDAFQTNWRIVNARAWSLLPKEGKYNAQQWHSDGYAKCMLKVMIYVSGASKEYRGTEIQHLNGRTELTEGGPGTFLLFNPTLLLHRAVAPSKFRRDVIEITFAQSTKTIKTLIHATFNGRYPSFTWIK